MSVRLKTGTQSAGFFKRNTQMTRPAFEPAGIIQENGSGLIEPYKPHPSVLRTLDVLFLFIYLTRVQNPAQSDPLSSAQIDPLKSLQIDPLPSEQNRCKLTPSVAAN
jgi:hypothetical protein